MSKVSWKPGTMVYPAPAVLVSCGSPERGNANMLTVAWVGTVCTNPPMLYISVRPERFSYPIIESEQEFTVNLTTVEMARATDWCGVRSGCDFNKFDATGLTATPGIANSCCMIEESPLSIECKVKEIKPLGSHNMIIADVVGLVADDRFIDPSNGYFDLEAAALLSFCHGKYYAPGKFLGKFGFSVMKRVRKPDGRRPRKDKKKSKR